MLWAIQAGPAASSGREWGQILRAKRGGQCDAEAALAAKSDKGFESLRAAPSEFLPNEMGGDAFLGKFREGDFQNVREIEGILVGNAANIARRQRPGRASHHLRCKEERETQCSGPFVGAEKKFSVWPPKHYVSLVLSMESIACHRPAIRKGGR